MKIRSLAAVLAASVALPAGTALADDLEVTHWWTSGGEAAAVAEFAKAFDATGNNWVDGAIAGGGDTARPIMISRITGGDPMGATQFNHGRQAEELVEAGLMRDLDRRRRGRGLDRRRQPAVAARRLHARRPDLLRPGQHPLLAVAVALEQGLRGCRRRRCRPTGTSSSPPRRRCEAAGKIPLAMGEQPWQQSGAFNVMIARPRRQGPVHRGLRRQGRRGRRRPGDGRDLRGRRPGPRDGRGLERPGLEPGDQHGHHRQGRRPDHGRLGAGRVPGGRPGRRHGLHLPAGPRRERRSSTTGGDAFYFPKIRTTRKSTAAQEELAAVMLSPETQVAFNLKKGSLPIRGDVDLAAANDCMKKGLEISGRRQHRARGTDAADHARTPTRRSNDLMTEFFSDMSMTPADAQARFAEIIARRRLTPPRSTPAGPRPAGRPVSGTQAWRGGRRMAAARRDQASCSATSAPRSPRSR